MTTVLLYRAALGELSCKGIVSRSSQIDAAMCNNEVFPDNTTTVIRWGTTSNIPEGCSVINTAKAIHRVSDKSGFRKLLMKDYETKRRASPHEYHTPLCPMTWFDNEDQPPDDYTYPLIVRPAKHAESEDIHLARNPEQLSVAREACGEGHYFSSFVNKTAEYRITYMQGRVVYIVKKTPRNPARVSWGLGVYDNVRWGEWPLEAVKQGLAAFLLSKLDFGGVDVIVNASGRAYVLEINTGPLTESPYRQTCMAKCFDWLLSSRKETIPVVATQSWKDFIHPALSEQAVTGD